jgi:hypothetical protein
MNDSVYFKNINVYKFWKIKIKETTISIAKSNYVDILPKGCSVLTDRGFKNIDNSAKQK